MVATKHLLVMQLQELERDYRRLAQNPCERPLHAVGRLMVWMDWQKPQFRPGDDVWNQMEERTRLFVEEMSARS